MFLHKELTNKTREMRSISLRRCTRLASRLRSWRKLSLIEQLGNIGSEVGRVRQWASRDEKLYNNAVKRAFELFDLTLADLRWKGRLREIARSREVFCDAITGGKEYKSSLEDLEKYFFYFAFLSQRRK